METTVRDANGADAEALLRLSLLAGATRAVSSAPAAASDALSNLRRCLESGEIIAAVVVVDGVVVSGGMASLFETAAVTGSGRRAWIWGVGTDPEHRRRGNARAVLERLVARLDALDVEKAELSASPDGLGLYRSLGFQSPALPRLQRTRA